MKSFNINSELDRLEVAIERDRLEAKLNQVEHSLRFLEELIREPSISIQQCRKDIHEILNSIKRT